jgi:large subunit ribosomal protein L13
MKTFSATPRDITKRWYVVDAEDMVLGRLASEVAKIIRGKHKPIFTPHHHQRREGQDDRPQE